MNLHRIFLTQDGFKLDHPWFRSLRRFAQVWTTGRRHPLLLPPSQSAEPCTYVKVSKKDGRFIWLRVKAYGLLIAARLCLVSTSTVMILTTLCFGPDHDPYNEVSEKHGAGQTYMYKLFIELMRAGFRVCLMIPDTNPTKEAKGPDWEDIAVNEKVLEMPLTERFDYLRTRALEGGVFTPTGHVKKISKETFLAEAKVA
jgi:putative DNA primase/helicase